VCECRRLGEAGKCARLVLGARDIGKEYLEGMFLNEFIKRMLEG